MTATEELCALLDARGVEWDYGVSGPDSTMFRANGVDLTFTSMRNRLVCSTILTPAQAVEATLGRETCTMAHEDGNDTWWSCSVCDADVYLPTKPKFCWNCGREVVE